MVTSAHHRMRSDNIGQFHAFCSFIGFSPQMRTRRLSEINCALESLALAAKRGLDRIAYYPSRVIPRGLNCWWAPYAQLLLRFRLLPTRKTELARQTGRTPEKPIRRAIWSA